MGQSGNGTGREEAKGEVKWKWKWEGRSERWGKVEMELGWKKRKVWQSGMELGWKRGDGTALRIMELKE